MMKIIGHRQRIALAAAVVVLAALGGRPLMAQPVSVGTCITGATQYATIQAAVTAVAPGTTIQICPGNYPEQVVIDKNLTLVGQALGNQRKIVLTIPAGGFVPNTSSLTSGDPLAAQILVESPATAVTIADIAVDGAGNNLNNTCSDPRLIGIFYRNASGLLATVVVRNQAQGPALFGCASSAGLGIFIQSSGASTPSTVAIRDSTLYGYQKNGITANEPGTTVTLFGNSVLGAGPTVIAQNGIQVGYGATGMINENMIADDVFNGNPTAGTASGILIFDSGGMTIAKNSVNFTQNGIAIQTDGTLSADGNSVSNNLVMNTQLGDGIDICSNTNKVNSNNVFTSGQAGIHLDSTCGTTGNNNYVVRNVVNDACSGFLIGTGTTGNGIGSNTAVNTDFTTLAGDTCTPVVFAARANKEALAHGHAASPVRP